MPDRWAMLENWFAGYNGRYIGNISILLMTRYTLFKVANIASVVFLIPFIAYFIFIKNRFGGKKVSHSSVFLLCSILLFAVPGEVFRQTYGFPAGFANYANPVVFILLFYLWVQKIFCDDKIEFPLWQTILMFPLGIITTLFSEHNSIFCIMMAIVVICYTAIVKKKIYCATIVYFLSTCMGSFLMFSNSGYHGNVISGYKELNFSFLAMMKKYVLEMSNFLFFDNLILNLCFAVGSLVLIANSRSSKPGKSFFYSKWITTLFKIILIFFSLYQLICKLCPSWNLLGNKNYTAIFNAIFSGLFIFVVILCIILYISSFGRKMRMLAFLLGAIASVMPLFIASPIGSRCFLTSYCLLAMCGIDLILYVISKYFQNVSLSIYLLPIFAVTLIFFGTIFGQIGIFGRTQYARLQQETKEGTKEIYVDSYPNSQYIWVIKPPEQHWKDAYLYFYNLPPDTVIHWRN